MPKRKAGQLLTEREQAFVDAYCVQKNAREAARKAGYGEAMIKKAATVMVRKPHIAEAIDAKLKEIARQVNADAKWVRQRLIEEATDYSEGATHSGRVKAIELIGRLNGDFEADNKQKAGIFEDVPSEVLEKIREKLRGVSGQSVVAGKSGAGTGGGFTH